MIGSLANFLSGKISFKSAVVCFAWAFYLIPASADNLLFYDLAQSLDPVFFLERF
jgi:hypothetical protein